MIHIMVIIRTMEIWKTIKNYENYEVSNLGNVRNTKFNNRLLKPSIINGYYRIRLCKDGKYKAYFLHKLVAETFLSNPNKYSQVNHKDEDKSNNTLSNLEWCDSSYNINYGKRNSIVSAKLSKKIAQYDLNGNLINTFSSQIEAHNISGISMTSISDCVNGKQKTAGGFIWRRIV